jgi:hypothetical protein
MWSKRTNIKFTFGKFDIVSNNNKTASTDFCSPTMSVRLLKKQLTDHDARAPARSKTSSNGPQRRAPTKKRRHNLISEFAREQRREKATQREQLQKSRARLARENEIELQLAETTRRALAATAPRAVAPPASTAALLANNKKTNKGQKAKRRRFGDDEDDDSGANAADDDADVRAAARERESDFVSARAQTLPGDGDDDDDDADPDAYDVGAGRGGRGRGRRGQR